MIDLTKLVTTAHKTEAAALAERHASNAAHQSYLDATDWMALRQLETNKPMPADVAAKRQLARAGIVTITGVA